MLKPFMTKICSENTKSIKLKVSRTIHHYLQLPVLDFSNYYPDYHKLEVILFKYDKTAIASLSDSLKQQQVLSEAPTSLLLANTKHRENTII